MNSIVNMIKDGVIDPKSFKSAIYSEENRFYYESIVNYIFDGIRDYFEYTWKRENPVEFLPWFAAMVSSEKFFRDILNITPQFYYSHSTAQYLEGTVLFGKILNLLGCSEIEENVYSGMVEEFYITAIHNI